MSFSWTELLIITYRIINFAFVSLMNLRKTKTIIPNSFSVKGVRVGPQQINRGVIIYITVQFNPYGGRSTAETRICVKMAAPIKWVLATGIFCQKCTPCAIFFSDFPLQEALFPIVESTKHIIRIKIQEVWWVGLQRIYICVVPMIYIFTEFQRITKTQKWLALQGYYYFFFLQLWHWKS